MANTLATVGAAALVLIGGFAGYVAMQPDDMHVSRSTTIEAPPEVVFALLDDFTSFPRWSPWQEMDPDMTTELSGPESGVGAAYAWKGNDDVGAGTMEITAMEPGRSVTQALHFTEPFEATNTAVFEVEPAESGTRITWTMTGKKDFGAKMAGVFMDIEGMVGQDFERGLARMDAAATADVEAAAEAAEEARAAAEAEVEARLEEAEAMMEGEQAAAPSPDDAD